MNIENLRVDKKTLQSPDQVLYCELMDSGSIEFIGRLKPMGSDSIESGRVAWLARINRKILIKIEARVFTGLFVLSVILLFTLPIAQHL